VSWAQFSSEIIGATDSAAASADSLRGTIHARWRELGIGAAPSASDNAIHASASPLEALAERCIWLGRRPHQDGYGTYLLRCGLGYNTIVAWLKNPMVCGEPIFDQVKGMDALPMAAAAVALEAWEAAVGRHNLNSP